jgi:integrase
MATKNLTKATVKAATYRPGGASRQVIWDAKLRGFGCRVTPEGGRSFVILYRANGRQRLMSLGPVQDFKTLDEARTRAGGLLHGLRQDGIDPMAARERMAAAESMDEAWGAYERDHIAKQSANTRRAVRSIWSVHLAPVVASLKPGQVTKADAIRVLDRASERGGPVVANRAVQRLRAMLAWLHDRNDKQFPDNWRNPAVVTRSRGGDGLKLHRENPREHILDIEQLRRLLTALAQEDPWVRSFVSLLMMTGARKEEIRTLQWDAVDLERGTATLPKTKNGKPFTLSLPPGAVAILRDLPVVSGSPFVFPQHRATPRQNGPQPMIEPRHAYKRALKRAGLPASTTFHDLRRSFATVLAMNGESAEAISRALNNTSTVAAKHYIQLADDVKRRLTDQFAAQLLLAERP